MARVEIMERAWSDSKLKRLAVNLGVTKTYAIGIIATLWHDSQNENKSEVTAEDLNIWFADDIAKGLDIPSILVVSNYLEKTAYSTYRVCGNKTQLVKVNSYRKRAKTAILSRWKKNAKPNIAEESQTVNADTTSILEDKKMLLLKYTNNNTTRQNDNKKENAFPLRGTPPAFAAGDSVEVLHSENRDDTVFDISTENPETSSILTKKKRTLVNGTEQSNTSSPLKAGKRLKPKLDTSKGGNEVVATYCSIYKQKFDRNPDIVGKEAGAAKRLAKDLGVERACQLVEGYLQMNDAWFIKNDYRLSILGDNVNKVGLFLEKGITITSKMAASVETQSSNAAVAQRVLSRLKGAENDKRANGASEPW